MRGHITKRGNDSYTIVINLGRDPATGKRKQQWVSIKGTKKDAEKKLAELLHQVDSGTYMKPGKMSVKDYLERRIRDYAYMNLSPRTAECYEHVVESHLVPALGNLTLAQLKAEHLQHYYADKLERGRCDGKGGLSAQTVRHHHMCLHRALETARQWGLLIRNPADAVDLPRVQHHEMQTWDMDGVKQFLEIAKATPYYALFYAALFTGMRRSELLALRWQDCDILLGQINVTRSLHVLKGGRVIYRSPKTANGRRTIALPPSAAMVLRKHYENRKLDSIMVGAPLTEESLVFSQPDGRPLLPNSMTHAWVRTVRRGGLKPIRLHDARHTHASLLLKQGIHGKVVQERLGHSSIAITLDTYSHVAPGMQEAAARRFDEAFGAEYNE